jgi:hypothetical protein
MTIEAGGLAGLEPERLLVTRMAIAPVIGAARVVSAAGSIIKAYERGEERAEDNA